MQKKTRPPYLWVLNVLRQVGLGLLSLFTESEPVVHCNLKDNTVAVEDPLPDEFVPPPYRLCAAAGPLLLDAFCMFCPEPLAPVGFHAASAWQLGPLHGACGRHHQLCGREKGSCRIVRCGLLCGP